MDNNNQLIKGSKNQETMPLPSEIFLKTCQKTGCVSSPGLLSAIHSAVLYPIREYGEQKFAILATQEIALIALEYTGADLDASAPAIKECARILLSQYSNLSLSEIREAFVLAATKTICADLSAYSGQFTVKLFGDVLSAYSEYRRPIYAALIREIEEARDREREKEIEELNAKTRDAIIESFKTIMATGVCEFETAEKIPHTWAPILVEEKLVFGDANTWIEAKQSVVERFKLQQSLLIPDETIAPFDCRRIYQAIKDDPGHFPADLRPRAEILYGKLIVFKEIQTKSRKAQIL